MAKDYKNRAKDRKRYPAQKRSPLSWWKGGASVLLISLFAGFLYFLKTAPQEKEEQQIKLPPAARKASKKPEKTPKPKQSLEKKKPKFEFYTLLPKKEIVVPEREIKTRSHEQQFGQLKTARYMIQVGSFRSYREADSLKAQLALLGIESKIERAKIGDTVWNRVRIGPLSKMTHVNKTRSLLRQHKIDAVVMQMN